MLITTSNIIFTHNHDMAKGVFRKHSETNIDDLQIFCGVCDKRSAILRWDENYVGYRGRCSLCEYDWPES